MGSEEIIVGLGYFVVFLFSTTLHEAAHAWVAMKGGDLTAYLGGQVSLDPIPHIRREPFGMVVLPLLSVMISGWPFGFASAPYDPMWARRHPKRAGWMALAGPGANLTLVFLSLLCIRLGYYAGVFFPPSSVSFGKLVGTTGGGVWPGIGFLVGATFSINLLLGIFNLLPLPPLDGSGAVPLLLNARQTERYQDFLWGQPALMWVGIIVAWQIFHFVFDPIWSVALDVLYPGVSYG